MDCTVFVDKIICGDYDVKISSFSGNRPCPRLFLMLSPGQSMGLAQRTFRLVLAMTLIAGLTASPALAAKKKSSAPNNRYASIVIDAETGQILSQSSPDKTLYPASLTKVMTLLLTFEALENGSLTLRDRVPISRRAANMSPSKIGLPVGASIRVEDAIYALVTKSANDIAVALAEKVGGSESRFATQMTRKAREIGMTNTRFVNASGWHDPSQVTSARDMARLAQYVIYRYPQYYHYFSTRNFTYQGKNYHNHNRLMSEYPGMDGMKTGYVAASGFNLVASAKRGNKRLIGVVFGGRSASSRNAHMAELLNKGFKGQGATGGELLVASISRTLQAPPVPDRKPIEIVRSAAMTRAVDLTIQTTTTAMQSIAPAAGTPTPPAKPSQYASLNTMMQGEGFSELIGEGDYDPAVSKRLETGLMAIAAVKHEPYVPSTESESDVSDDIPEADAPWAIQIGAFSSRVQTDKAIRAAMQALPSTLAAPARPVIVPLKTADGWVFRGRLSGYTKDQAASACSRLRDCLTVSPDANR